LNNGNAFACPAGKYRHESVAMLSPALLANIAVRAQQCFFILIELLLDF